MRVPQWIVNAVPSSEDVWRRHANPWSVYTRFAAIPAMILAVWSRVWIDWWALLPVALVILWLLLNPLVFPPVTAPRRWVSKGIYGERLWLRDKSQLRREQRVLLRWLIALGIAGMFLLGWGLWQLSVWPTVFGATLIIVAQLWRIDRMGWLYEESERTRSAAP